MLNVNQNNMFRRKLRTGYAWQFDLIGHLWIIDQYGSEDVDREVTLRALDYMAKLCAPMDEESEKLIRELYLTVRYGTKERENYELMQQGFRILQPVLAGYVCHAFQAEYGDKWWDKIRKTLAYHKKLPQSGSYSELAESLDSASCLLIILDGKWNDLFYNKMNLKCSFWADELWDIWIHINFGSKPLNMDQEYTRFCAAMNGLEKELAIKSTEATAAEKKEEEHERKL